MLFALLGIVIGSAIGALITGLVLMLIAPITASRKPTYGEAYMTMFFAHIGAGLVNFLLSFFVLDSETGEAAIWPSIVGWAAGFAILTYFIGSKLETTLSRAALTALVMTVIGIIFSVVLVVLTAGVFVAGGAAGN